MQGLDALLTTNRDITRGPTEVSANRACLFAAGCFWEQLFVSVYSRHNAQHVIVYSIDTDLSGGSARNGGGREHELEDGVVNAREVAAARGLMFLGSQRKGVDVDTSIRGTGVVLERLDNVEVGTLTLREAVLAVELELGSDARILTPAVHVKGGLGKHEGAGIGDEGARVVTALRKGSLNNSGRGPVAGGGTRSHSDAAGSSGTNRAANRSG